MWLWGVSYQEILVDVQHTGHLERNYFPCFMAQKRNFHERNVPPPDRLTTGPSPKPDKSHHNP